MSLTYTERIDLLRATKVAHTTEKQRVIGAMDFDDHPIVLPPEKNRRIVELMGPSGVPIKDVLFADYLPEANHPAGGFFGARQVGRNFRRLLETHPTYVDPVSSLAGCYMTNFNSYRTAAWNPDIAYDELRELQDRYRLQHGIGAMQHFCQDLTIGYELGWDGILARINDGRKVNRDAEALELYDGLEDVVTGIRSWISRNADEALRMAANETEPQFATNLEEIAEINSRLVHHPPGTFREVLQWTLWYQMAARMYNSSGSLGRFDVLLEPYYRRDIASGRLTDEEAIFHIACYLVMDTAYFQLGGPDADGTDVTGRMSYLILEAAHRLKIPVNAGVCVGDSVDPGLLHRGVEIIVQDRAGTPKFLGVENTIRGFMRNGYPENLARQRAYSGCHWSALPGREYTVNDCVKINLAAVFEVALNDMIDNSSTPSTDTLMELYRQHLECAVETTAKSLDFHIEHMWEVMPELVLDLLCHGPIERGRDASHHGVEYVNLCIDAAGLATVADSFAALEQRIDTEKRITWEKLREVLGANWGGEDGAAIRSLMRSVPRYGSGGTRADAYASHIADMFTAAVKAAPTPAGHNMIPGIFSWAATIFLGHDVGPTPNGRGDGDPISHGPNPDPGFRADGAPTALALAVASVQPGWGNTAPLQLELDPGIVNEKNRIELVKSLITTHFDLGGTQINLNIVDRETILDAHEHPEKYPELVVRVTGFSAYFGSLSPEFRRLVVDRILS